MPVTAPAQGGQGPAAAGGKASTAAAGGKASTAAAGGKAIRVVPPGGGRAPRNPLQEFYETPGVPLRSGPDRARRQARMLARVLRDRDFSGPAVIIDVGCGDGSTLAAMAGENQGHRFAGIDWSSDGLRQARVLGLTVLRGGVAPGLPVADGTADVVIMSEFIEHLVDPDGAVAEVRRVLRPGGSLLLSTPNLAAWYNRALLAVGVQPVFSEVSLRGVYGRPGSVVAGHLRLFTRRALAEFLAAGGFRCVTMAGARYHGVPRPLGPLDRAFCRWPSAASILLVHARKALTPMAQASRTRTAAKHAAQHRRQARLRLDRLPLTRLRLNRLRLAHRPSGPLLELGGLAVGLAAGLCIALGVLSPASPRHPPAAAVTHRPLVVPGASAPDPAALDAEWAAYSDRSGCADWAGGDGVSAIRLNSSQLAWFFSDTYLGPAGSATGFSRISGFVNNSVVIQTRAGHASSFVTMTGGGACSGPGRPGQAAPVVAPPAAPGGPADRYWDEDGITVGRTVVKFYNRYLAGSIPFVPAGTVIATFGVSQLSAAGHGPAYGAVARPALIPLPSWTPPGGTSPVIWGAALLQAGSTAYVYGTQSIQGQGSQGAFRQLYLARVPLSRLTTFSAWRFYAGAGQWAARQQDARPVPPPDGGVSSGFSVVAIGGRYWLIEAGAAPGSQDVDAYPASEPWGPFGPGVLLYRNPAIGLDAAHDYRIMYEARAEPALSTGHTLVISYNVNSEAVTAGCVPMSAFTNTVTQPRFITVPLAAFDPGPGTGTGAVRTASVAPDYPRVVPRHPSQWFNSWSYPDGCPPVPGLTAVRASLGADKVTLSWPDAGLGVRYRVYLQGPTDIPAATAYGDSASFAHLQPGGYLARVVPVNTRQDAGVSAETTFIVP